MIINVKGYLTYREVIGQQEIQQPDDILVTLVDFIRGLAEALPEKQGQTLFDHKTGTINQSVAIMLNGVHYNHLPDRLETVLKDQDEIAVFPPGVGG
jgi:molybdopterin converting factor small subunit